MCYKICLTNYSLKPNHTKPFLPIPCPLLLMLIMKAKGRVLTQSRAFNPVTSSCLEEQSRRLRRIAGQVSGQSKLMRGCTQCGVATVERNRKQLSWRVLSRSFRTAGGFPCFVVYIALQFHDHWHLWRICSHLVTSQHSFLLPLLASRSIRPLVQIFNLQMKHLTRKRAP